MLKVSYERNGGHVPDFQNVCMEEGFYEKRGFRAPEAMKTERCPPAFPSSPGWRPQPGAGRQARAPRGSPPSPQPVIHRRARTPTPLSSASHSLSKTQPNCSSGRRDTPLLGFLGPRPARGSRRSPDPFPRPAAFSGGPCCPGGAPVHASGIHAVRPRPAPPDGRP